MDVLEGMVSRKKGYQGSKGGRKEGHQERATVMAVEVVVVAINEGRASRKGNGDGGGGRRAGRLISTRGGAPKTAPQARVRPQDRPQLRVTARRSSLPEPGW